MFDDQYDVFCSGKLAEAPAATSYPHEADDVVCACAEYLASQGHNISSHTIQSQQAMAVAAQLIQSTMTQQGESS